MYCHILYYSNTRVTPVKAPSINGRSGLGLDIQGTPGTLLVGTQCKLTRLFTHAYTCMSDLTTLAMVG